MANFIPFQQSALFSNITGGGGQPLGAVPMNFATATPYTWNTNPITPEPDTPESDFDMGVFCSVPANANHPMCVNKGNNNNNNNKKDSDERPYMSIEDMKSASDEELIDYLNRPYYVGVGDPNLSVWRNFYNGQIAEVGLWSYALKDYEMELIFDKGIINNKGEYTTSKLPVGTWDFKSGYSDITFDISGNGNHAKFHNVEFANKSLKSNTERYLPYRRNGAYGYLSSEEQFLNLQNLMRSEHPEIMTNRNTFNKKVRNQMQDVDKDGLSSTKFRIVNRQNYQGKHEIIEVVI